MAATAEERISALTSSEDIFSLAVPFVACSENRIGENAPEGEKLHQGIFSKNRAIAVGATWAKCPGTHQDSGQWWSKTVLGIAIDANGSTLSDPSGKSYSWDFENRLTQAVVPGTGTTTFRYDPFGRRIQKYGPLGTTNYLYDGVNARANITEELDSSGNVLADYSHGSESDEHLSQLRSGATSLYDQDALESVTALSASTGALANTYVYDSFGKRTSSSGTVTNPFQFTGRELDSETGLYYFRARYYDQNLGRFLNEDPIEFDGGVDFYGYARGNPANRTDPSGKTSIPIPIYGNWCGPNWTGHRFEQYDPAHDVVVNGKPYYKKPDDAIDAVCEEHDKCYYRCRSDFPCDKTARQNCMRQQCDSALVGDLLLQPKGFWNRVIPDYIDFFNDHPDAGDNAKGCNCGKPDPGTK